MAGPIGAIALPPSLSSLKPFLDRARELQAHDPAVSYWCLLYAVEAGQRLKAADGMPALLGIMDALESLQQLPALKDNEVVTSQVAGQAHVTNLALRVFQGADDEDRAGKASKSTATRFLAASTFFEVLNTFGALEDEVREKQKYAKWKAGDIAKALREGRTPHAGPIGGPSEPALIDPPVASEEVETAVDEAAVADTTEDDRDIERHLLGLGSAPSDAIEPSLPDPSAYPSFDTSSAPVTSVSAQPLPPPSAPPLASAPPAPSAPSAPFAAAVLPSAPPLPPPTIAGPSQPARPSPAFSAPGPAASAFDPMIIVKAQKHAKWAISALNFDDVNTARKELRAALDLIGG